VSIFSTLDTNIIANWFLELSDLKCISSKPIPEKKILVKTAIRNIIH